MPCEMLYSTDTHLQGTNALQPTQWGWIYCSLLAQGKPPIQAPTKGAWLVQAKSPRHIAHLIDREI